MADTKALFTQRLDAARTAWTHGDEPAAADYLREAIVAARSDRNLRRELASALFNLGKLSRKFGQAGEAEAGLLLTEALAIGEELFGTEHTALAPLLHELSRLRLQQSQHSRAEDALGRLLAIARLKGEEHPDVAAALVDLAFVKRKLGDDASAEALYRDALRIREKVLEPNHMDTIGTLERLSETCAARGNFAEALALLYRALPTREAALGAGHERVRAARSRAAQLEAQMAAVAANSVMDSSIETPSVSQIVRTSSESARPSWGFTDRESGATHRDVFLADVAHADVVSVDVVSVDVATGDIASGEVASGGSSLGDWRSIVALVQRWARFIASHIRAIGLPHWLEPARKRRTVQYASAGMGAIGIAIAGLLVLLPRVGSSRTPVPAETSAAQRTTAAPVVTAPVTRTASIGTGAAAMMATTHADSLRTASPTPVPSPAVIQQEQRAPESARPELRLPRIKVQLDSINIPSMPEAPSADAILRLAIERQRAADSGRAETRDEFSRPTLADVENARTAPKILGRPPEPAFPDALLRLGAREGLVIVRFLVTELGRADVATMIVERSDHDRFTDAVRDVLPRFRFEPAHTLGPLSRPVAAWVSVPFRFTTKKK